MALTNQNLHGIVPFFQAAKEAGIKPIVRAELKTVNGQSSLVYVRNQAAYALCNLLSIEQLTERHILSNRTGLIYATPQTHALLEVR